MLLKFIETRLRQRRRYVSVFESIFVGLGPLFREKPWRFSRMKTHIIDLSEVYGFYKPHPMRIYVYQP